MAPQTNERKLRRDSVGTVQKIMWISKSKDSPVDGETVTALLAAAARGDQFEVSRMLDANQQKGLNVGSADVMSRTALHAAAGEGMVECSRMLLKLGADVNAKDAWDGTPLDDAIKNNHKEVEKVLLGAGGKLGNLKVSAKRLFVAVAAEDIGSIESIINGGTPVDSVDADSRTPLHHAVAQGSEKSIDALIKAGAKLNVVDNFGLTPLGEAARHATRTGENKIREKLIAAGALAAEDDDAGSYKKQFVLAVGAAQLFFIIMFGFATTYAPASIAPPSDSSASAAITAARAYSMFMDVHVMIFIGFGFLMTFLRKYGHSSVGLNFLVAAFVMQWYLLCGSFIEQAFADASHIEGGRFHKISLGIGSLLLADFAAAAVLITFGALLGKVTPLQLLMVAFIEIIIFSVNEQILYKLGIQDVGGSIVVHLFGAYFGLAASWVLSARTAFDNADNASVYHSDLFAMIGSVFLWVYWPSFVASPAGPLDQERAIVATTLSLAASCVSAFAFSVLLRGGKFSMVDVQNATLAGGVAIGSAANLHAATPATAVVIGTLGGALSVLGYTKIQPKLETMLQLHDTCGVNNLHGMPAILAALASAVVISYNDVGYFPSASHLHAIDPNNGRFAAPNSNGTVAELRSAGTQAGFQIACMVVSFVMAVAGGLLTGLLVKLVFGGAEELRMFLDKFYWEVPGLEMPFYFDQRGEINRESMIEEVQHSVHGNNMWLDRARAGSAGGADIETAADSPNRCASTPISNRPAAPQMRGGMSILPPPSPQQQQAEHGSSFSVNTPGAAQGIISNELLSMKLDLVLQSLSQNLNTQSVQRASPQTTPATTRPLAPTMNAAYPAADAVSSTQGPDMQS